MSVAPDNDTLRQLILDDIKAGKTYRTICKDRHVSPKTIKRIKEGKPSEQESKGEIAAQAFDRFGKNEKPTLVVINLKQPPELIQELFVKYSEMEGSVLLSKSEKEEILSMLSSVGFPCNDVETFKASVKAIVTETTEWNKFTFNCSTCNKPVKLVDTPDGLSHLTQGNLLWQHKGECFEKSPKGRANLTVY